MKKAGHPFGKAQPPKRKRTTVVAQRLTDLRYELNATADQVASYFGFSAGWWNNFECSKWEPSPAHLEAIADAFDTTVDYILGKSDVRFRRGHSAEYRDPPLRRPYMPRAKRNPVLVVSDGRVEEAVQ